MITVKGQPEEPGCYVAGWWGRYATARMVHIADEILETSFGDDIPHEDDDDYFDQVIWIADESEAALNKVTEGGYWGWENGEFYLFDENEDDSL